jgi:hypothetical protein
MFRNSPSRSLSLQTSYDKGNDSRSWKTGFNACVFGSVVQEKSEQSAQAYQ